MKVKGTGSWEDNGKKKEGRERKVV